MKQQVVSGIKDKGIGTNEQFAQQLFSEKANNGKSVQDLGREQKTIEDKDKNTQEL